ncbi:MAG: class II glutamine amidotransferase [Proteobacteria bacterium]|nr:class II glutamine amidotransferase [Pseudomonadota bacterium]
MCQLLGMNCNVPTDICFSFDGFSKRGGETGDHRDGFGIAFFEDKGVKLFLDSKPTIDSPIAEYIKTHPIHSLNVIAHIRKATQGKITLENCHPFIRQMWKKNWIFAHNGNLEHLVPTSNGYYSAIGDTDSETAFCDMLNRLYGEFGNQEPPIEILARKIRNISHEISTFGSFNYLLSNGEFLFCHCSTKLTYIVRQAPFSNAHLIDEDITVDFSLVTTSQDRVAVIATEPLTDNEIWTDIHPGELLIFNQGQPFPARY